MTVDYSPRTRNVPARALRVGDVVMESPEHPARIVQIRCGPGKSHAIVHVWCRYTWQSDTERAWLLGSYDPERPVERAVC